MLEKIKNIFSDNYKVLTFITLFYYLITVICVAIYADYAFSGRSSETGKVFFLWINFIYSIWTTIKLFKSDSKSSWILFFIFSGLFFNPIKQINFGYNYEVEFYTLFVCFIMMLIYNEFFSKANIEKIKKIFKRTKESCIKFAQHITDDNK